MTVTKLIKQLEIMKKKHGPRAKVSFDCEEMMAVTKGVFDIVEIGSLEYKHVLIGDGDGGVIENKDGSERGHCIIVLST